jgi:alkylation response protein AidB-like acyl-CoA dehydrogenase
MDFSMSEAHRQFGDSFEDFCRRQIAPRAAEADRTSKLPRENWTDLVEMGFFGLYHETRYGGLGDEADWLMRALAEEALSKACASTFLSTGASIGLCGGPIAHHGSDALKERWLPRLVSGELIGCFGLTEPDAGTDAASIRTRARKVGDTYVLNGEKALITNAPDADVALVMAVTDPDASYAGVTAFVVDLTKAGVTRTDPYRKMGLRASSTGGLIFEDVELGPEDVLGQEGAGFIQAMTTLESGRISMSHFGIGIAEAAFEAACNYAMERKAFGRPISRKQAVHFKIADMKIEIDAARLMARKVAWMKDRGMPCQDMASIAKCYATEMAVRVTDQAVQVFGGWGYTDDFPVDRLYRDARLGPIGEGTSEIQRELIARHMDL